MSPLKPPSLAEIAAKQGDDIDSRYHPSAAVRRQLNKVFPTHWSFLLGEIALYSFIVLLITGVYLTLFFDSSMAEVTYSGVYQPLRGVEMSKAYASTLDISFEVRGGLFVRQVHHWAALMFSASIMVHLARIFFTGAFRRPRETNWVIGSLLLILSMFEGYFGYSLPDDLLSGIGLRAALSSISLGMPVIGTWLHWALFGGDFPCGGLGYQCSPTASCCPACTRCTSCCSRESSWRSSVFTWRWCGSRSTPSSPAPAAPRRMSSACGSCRCSRSSPARSSR